MVYWASQNSPERIYSIDKRKKPVGPNGRRAFKIRSSDVGRGGLEAARASHAIGA